MKTHDIKPNFMFNFICSKVDSPAFHFKSLKSIRKKNVSFFHRSFPLFALPQIEIVSDSLQQLFCLYGFT